MIYSPIQSHYFKQNTQNMKTKARQIATLLKFIL